MSKNLVAKLLLASSLVAVSAMAESAFIGVEGGYNFKNKLEDLSDKSPSIGIKGGYDFDTYRVYGQYNYNAKAKDNDSFTENKTGTTVKGDLEWLSHDFLVGVDATPEINNDLRFVAGVYTGLSMISYDLKASGAGVSVVASERQPGFIVGSKLGLLYDVNDQSGVELGFKADKAWYKSDIVDEKLKQTKYGAYVGYNFKF